MWTDKLHLVKLSIHSGQLSYNKRICHFCTQQRVLLLRSGCILSRKSSLSKRSHILEKKLSTKISFRKPLSQHFRKTILLENMLCRIPFDIVICRRKAQNPAEQRFFIRESAIRKNRTTIFLYREALFLKNGTKMIHAL